MKKLWPILAGVFALALGANAFAVPLWTDTYDPVDIKLTAPASVTYQHDITDGANGYRPGYDTITGATLSIWLYDDCALLIFCDSGNEYVKFTFDGNLWSNTASEVAGPLSADAFRFDVAKWLSDGVLTFVIQATQGDLYFAGSTLEVDGRRGGATTSVPEPSTLGLLGLGLLGLGFATTRRRRI